MSTDEEAEELKFDSAFAGGREAAVQWARRTKLEIQEAQVNLSRERREFHEEIARLREELYAQVQQESKQILLDKKGAKEELEDHLHRSRKELDFHRAPARFHETHKQYDDMITDHREKTRWAKVRRQREAEARKKNDQFVDVVNAAAADAIELNVGGTCFTVARSTLTQQPASLLNRYVSGRQEASRDREGRLYLDRDPVLFRSLLNFLRDDCQAPPRARDAVESEALCREAEHFGIRFWPYPVAYALGGHDGSGHLSTVEMLDVENQCWRASKAMALERSCFGAATTGSWVRVFGGQNADYKALGETECLDCLRGEWMPGSSLLVPRRSCAVAQDERCIYAIGGYDGERILSSVEAMDPRVRGWRSLGSLSTPRSAASAAMLGGRLWVVGGTCGERLRSAEVYDPRANRFEPVRADMCHARSAGGACTCRGRLFAIGGIGQDHTVRRSIEQFGVRDNGAAWTVLQSMTRARMDFGCCNFNEMIMVTGGQDGEVLSSAEFYKPEIDEWSPGPPMLSPRYSHQLAFVRL